MTYQICAKTVLDTSDPSITFDKNGISNGYYAFQNVVKPNWHPDEFGRQELERMVCKIKQAGKGKDFDCLLGLSGGMDSSYMLHTMVTKFGLRPLVFHVDGGWNTERAVHNIHVMVDKLKVAFYTQVIDWEEMRDFQRAWFKSGQPHIDIPQDHAFIASLYRFAEKFSVKYILNGGNISTEGVSVPYQFFYWGTDMVHIRDITKRFGSIPMKNYPSSSVYRHKLYLRYLKGITVLKPLNYMPYTKKLAIEVLEREYGWKQHPQKHFESRFTQFYEGYWLPTRFGFDVRRSHLSSLILTDQVTRDEALSELEKPPYDPNTIERDFQYVAVKLGIPSEELRSYQEMPKKFYWDYRNQHALLGAIEKGMRALGLGIRGGAF